MHNQFKKYQFKKFVDKTLKEIRQKPKPKVKLLINTDSDEIEKRYDDCHTYFLFHISEFYINWFIDCGEWFIYVDFKLFHFSFSSVGNSFKWKGVAICNKEECPLKVKEVKE